MKLHIARQQQTVNNWIQNCKKISDEKDEAEQRLKDFIPSFTQACELSQTWMMNMWQLAEQSQIFDEESLLSSKEKDLFWAIKTMDEQIHKMKLKGKTFYSENIMPEV